MKSLRTIVTITVLGAIIALSGCKGGGGNTEPVTDKQLGLLSKTWKIAGGGSVLKGSVDSTTYWTNFTITISGTKGKSTFNYACAGRPQLSVWPTGGTFQFSTTDPTKVIIRNDQANVTYSVDPSSAHLQMKFSFSGTGYTRLSNVSGDWIFNLIPN